MISKSWDFCLYSVQKKKGPKHRFKILTWFSSLSIEILNLRILCRDFFKNFKKNFLASKQISYGFCLPFWFILINSRALPFIPLGKNLWIKFSLSPFWTRPIPNLSSQIGISKWVLTSQDELSSFQDIEGYPAPLPSWNLHGQSNFQMGELRKALISHLLLFLGCVPSWGLHELNNPTMGRVSPWDTEGPKC